MKMNNRNEKKKNMKEIEIYLYEMSITKLKKNFKYNIPVNEIVYKIFGNKILEINYSDYYNLLFTIIR